MGMWKMRLFLTQLHGFSFCGVFLTQTLQLCFFHCLEVVAFGLCALYTHSEAFPGAVFLFSTDLPVIHMWKSHSMNEEEFHL